MIGDNCQRAKFYKEKKSYHYKDIIYLLDFYILSLNIILSLQPQG